jgi:hypothetical protein
LSAKYPALQEAITIVAGSTHVPVPSGDKLTLLHDVHYVADVVHSLQAGPHGVQTEGDPSAKNPEGHLLRH